MRILLPKWVKKEPFAHFLRYLETDTLEQLDAPLAQKLLWLADFFKIEELQQQCIDSVIIPSLSIDTVFLFLKDA